MKVVYSIVSIALTVALTSCTLQSSDEDERQNQEHQGRFLATSPLICDTSVDRDYVCQIQAVQHIELRALERGYLQDIEVDEGEKVQRGRIMFRLFPVMYEAEYNRAKAEMSLAEIEYRTTKDLADSNVVSRNELALAKARLEKARAEVAIEQAHLQFTKISAPFTGMMDRLHVRRGSLLEEGEILATLSDNSEMWVYFNVPEAEYLDFAARDLRRNPLRVRLRLANGEMFTQEGVVTTIEADFNRETGNIAFRATFPNPDGLLRHGETGNIVLRERLRNAILIPQKATFEVLDKKYVYVIDNSGRIHTREVSVRGELPHVFIVNNGVSASDRILLEGIKRVRDNDKIQVRVIGADSAIAQLQLHAE